jgi:phosphate-selective porin OprO/OprP
MIPRYCALPLAATALAGVAPAHAQGQDDIAAELRAMRAQIEQLQARVAELEAERSAAATAAPQVQLATMATAQPPAAAQPPAQPAPAEPDHGVQFRGAPTLTAPGGWSFKPRGRLQYDVGHVSRPAGITDSGLGFSNELRRARLGVEGTIPGGFGYVFELDFAPETVEVVDAILTYKAADPLTLTIGQHNGFQSLEELTSSRFSSFIERAAFTDAFNFERRVGFSGTFVSGDFTAQAGAFTDNVADLDDDGNNSAGLDGRVVFAPKLGETQLHFGGSAHWRDTGDLATMSTTRYRQRPLIHSTDVRFISTPALNVEAETNYGLEAALVHGPFHATGEVHWFEADTLTAGVSPTFFGGYAELGYYLTGETRGYRGARWDRTRVSRPLGDGGFGAIQLNLRYDYLDLTSDGVVGGTQNGVQASLIWIPIDYVRFLFNYARLSYDDAAIPAAGGDRDYSVDVFGARAQIDF